MTVIRVTRSGGFAGRVQHATIDTRTDPSGPALEAFLRARRGGLPHTMGADQLLYTFQLDGHRVVMGSDELPAELANLVRNALSRAP